MDIEVEVDLDDELVAHLMKCTGITNVQELVRRALEELVEREEERRSAQSQPTD